MSLSFSMIHSVPSISTRYFYVESVLFLIHLSDSSSILFSHCYSHLQIMSTMYHLCPLFIYRISANSFRGNYSFLNSTLCTVTFHHSTYKCGNYSREESIQGRKLLFSHESNIVIPQIVSAETILFYSDSITRFK